MINKKIIWRLFLGVMMISSLSLAENEPSVSKDQASRHHHEHDKKNECRFMGYACYGAYNNNLWVETISYTDEKGKPKKFSSGDSIFKMDQNTNNYMGYKLKRVTILAIKDSLIPKPNVGLFVNGREVGNQTVDSNGSYLSGYKAVPISFEVNDCPLDIMAIMSAGDMKLYSVSFYWEMVDGYDGGVHVPNNNISMIVRSLEINLKRMFNVVSPEAYARIIVPILNVTRDLNRQLIVCGIPCSTEQAKAVFSVKAEHENELNELGGVQAAARIIEHIDIAVMRIQEFYRINSN